MANRPRIPTDDQQFVNKIHLLYYSDHTRVGTNSRLPTNNYYGFVLTRTNPLSTDFSILNAAGFAVYGATDFFDYDGHNLRLDYKEKAKSVGKAAGSYAANTPYTFGLYQNNYFFTLNPQQIQYNNPHAVDITPLQYKNFWIDSQGIVTRRMTITGTTGFKFGSGYSTLDPNYTDGYIEYKRLVNFFDYYTGIKTNLKKNEKIYLLWYNLKDQEFYVCEFIDLTVSRDKGSPFLYNYQLTVDLLLKLKQKIIPSAKMPPLLINILQAPSLLAGVATEVSNFSYNLNRMSNAIVNSGVSLLGLAVSPLTILGKSVEYLTKIKNIFSPLAITSAINTAVQNTASAFMTLWNLGWKLFFNPNNYNYLAIKEGAVPPYISTDSSIEQILLSLPSNTVDDDTYRETVESQVAFDGTWFKNLLNFAYLISPTILDPATPPLTSIRANSLAKADLTYEDFKKIYDTDNISNTPEITTNFKSIVAKLISEGDTIEGILLQYYGTLDTLAAVAAINNISYPYISKDYKANTISPGGILLLPVYEDTDIGPENMAVNTDALNQYFGTDISISRSNSPNYDEWDIDLTETGDIKLVSGLPCYEQAINLRVITEQGSYLPYPDYGFLPPIGTRLDTNLMVLTHLAIESTMLSDYRTDSVIIKQLTAEGNVMTINAEIKPKKLSTTLELGAMLK